MSEPLLVVLNPRRIPPCLAAIGALEIDRLWMTGYTEKQIQLELPGAIATLDHDPIILLSDDTVPTQPALDAILEQQNCTPESVVTGHCNLDAASAFVNVTRQPFATRRSTPDAYAFYARYELERRSRPVRSWFAGMCLTAMSRELLARFPFKTSVARPSDFDLSVRLQAADVPILAPPAAFVWHVKERWNLPDQDPSKRLLIGEIPAESRLDLLPR